jgi:hypothetical protein
MMEYPLVEVGRVRRRGSSLAGASEPQKGESCILCSAMSHPARNPPCTLHSETLARSHAFGYLVSPSPFLSARHWLLDTPLSTKRYDSLRTRFSWRVWYFRSLAPSHHQLRLSVARSPREHCGTAFSFVLRAFSSLGQPQSQLGRGLRTRCKGFDRRYCTTAGPFDRRCPGL